MTLKSILYPHYPVIFTYILFFFLFLVHFYLTGYFYFL